MAETSTQPHATREDVAHLETRLIDRMGQMEVRLIDRIDQLRTTMQADMRDLRTTMQRQMWTLISVVSGVMIAGLIKLVFFP